MNSTAVKDDLLEKKEWVERFLARSPRQLAAFAFPAIFTWKDHFDFRFEVIDDALCIFADSILGTFLYLPPLGATVDGKVIEEVFRRMKETNGPGGITRIENVPVGLAHLFPQDKYSLYLKGHEYCYYKDDLTGLHGNAFKSKRGEYNHFVGNNSYEYLPYEDSMKDECLALYGDWAGERKASHADDIYRHMLDENHSVHEKALRFSRELGLVGRVVRVDKKIRAYTFGYPVNEKMFCVFLEVADISLKGLPVFIFREFCADPQLEEYHFINAMDDFAMPQLRETKMSFRPHVLLASYAATERGGA